MSLPSPQQRQSAVVELWSNMHCLTCQTAVPDRNVADHPAETTAQGAPQGKGVHSIVSLKFVNVRRYNPIDRKVL